MILKTIVAALLIQTGPATQITHKEADRALSALKAKHRPDRIAMIDAVIKAAAKHGVDPIWLLAVAYAESRHNAKLKGDKGKSHGPFQMTISAARAAYKRTKVTELYKWETAADVAAKYWARLISKYGHKVAPVIYNCGPIRCKKKNGKHIRSTPATRAYWRYYNKMNKGRKP